MLNRGFHQSYQWNLNCVFQPVDSAMSLTGFVSPVLPCPPGWPRIHRDKPVSATRGYINNSWSSSSSLPRAGRYPSFFPHSFIMFGSISNLSSFVPQLSEFPDFLTPSWSSGALLLHFSPNLTLQIFQLACSGPCHSLQGQ